MPTLRHCLTVLTALGVAACGGGGAAPASQQPPPTSSPPVAQSGTVSLAITDGPMEEATALVLHVTHVEFGHTDGEVTRLEVPNGSFELDMVQLQNGLTHDLLSQHDVPADMYEWMRIGIDPDLSHLEVQSGGHHELQFMDTGGLRVDEPFEIRASEHAEFVLDFDLRLGVQHHDQGDAQHHHQGGMMGDQYELHSALRLMHRADTGGLMGSIDASLVDANNPACDPAVGGNWAYLFPGDASEPEDIAESDTDGHAGPIATDHVELQTATGEYRYHFAFVPADTYRVAFTCAGEWDEAEDDDYPADPDGEFDFHAFSDPVDIFAGQDTEFHVSP